MAIREYHDVTQSTRRSDSDGSDDYDLKIIVDEPAEEDALDFQHYSKKLANIIAGTIPPQFAVGIFGKWGTGKTTLMRMIKRELDKDNEKILTVWFDAWRYENEKHLAVIPFLRQIRIVLENDLAKEKDGKTQRWTILREGLRRTFAAFIESTQLSVSIPGSPVSATINLEKAVDSLQSKGSTYIDGERTHFHEHITDHLKQALELLEKQKPGTRIVVFVEDLDRCTPEKALEVLESVKSFFDIIGIIYVIGMDSEREEAAIFIGINKVVARALEDKDDNSSSIYPCPIQNRFECPYDNNKEEDEEAKSIIDVDQLFQLSEIAFLVELAFAEAEKDTSKIQIKNRQDVYRALTDRETFDKLLQQGLDEEHQKYKNEIVELFMSIKDKVRIEDLRFYDRE